MFLTPSGRFETNTKICLSFSAFHPELWQPAWGIRLILEALIAFLPSPADGAIGALDWTSKERKRLAEKSRAFCCQRCGPISDLIPQINERQDGCSVANSEKPSRFQKEIEALKLAQATHETKNEPQTNEIGDNQSEHKQRETSSTAESTTEGISNDDDDAATSSNSRDPTSQAAPKPIEDQEPALAEEAKLDIDKVAQSNEKNGSDQEEDIVQDNNVLLENTDQFVGPEEAVLGVERDNTSNNEPTLGVTSTIDFLLNTAIVLLVAVCYLLARHLMQLQEELQQLKQGKDN
mmetsp:Transcript_31211/g.44308  ORF Transcript_31211/g.44308 Transcript_31211/m.44308 type:complete len:292 (+) Transcript_31211:138-1013(+)